MSAKKRARTDRQSLTNAQRKRPMVTLTLSFVALAELERLAQEHAAPFEHPNKSRVVDGWLVESARKRAAR